MKTSIFARVVAKPIAFPDDIQMQYTCLDEQGRPTGKIMHDRVHFRWAEVIHRFWIDVNYAKECEEYFRNGDSVFIGNREVTLDIDPETEMR